MDTELLAKIFEGGMLLCFGMAWPMSIIKMLRTKCSAGKSFFFLFIILCGYLCGITFKFVTGIDEILALYIFNTIMVTIDIILSFKYRAQTA